jgi:hypothetical protein
VYDVFLQWRIDMAEWGYEFDMKETEPGHWQSSYWLIDPSGKATGRTVLPVRTSQQQSLDEAEAAGKAEANRKNNESGV